MPDNQQRQITLILMSGMLRLPDLLALIFSKKILHFRYLTIKIALPQKMTQELKPRIQNDMKDAMRAKDQKRLDAIRLLLAAIKQREVDERIQLDDSQVLAVIDKMLKQRRDSIEQFTAANRQDLVDQEN